MSSAHNANLNAAEAQGAEFGLPSAQLKGEGGAVRAEVPASVAEHFESAQARMEQSGAARPSAPLDDTHKSGLEPVSERARDLTAVTEAKIRSGDAAETRSPNIGFPGREPAE